MVQGKPVICISSDSNKKSFEIDKEPRQIQLSKAYAAAIAAAGGVPVLAAELCADELAELCDGLVLSGGADVEPELYGESVLNDTVKCDPPRTAYELALIKAFIAREKPILAICRGMQVLNCALGGSLYQDLVEQKGWVHLNGKIRHEVYAEPDSLLYKLFGPVFRTNSTHHQAVKDLADGLRVTARSVEGIIEACEHYTLPVIGVQFHPERLTGAAWDERTPDFAPLFDHFINMVNDRAQG